MDFSTRFILTILTSLADMWVSWVYHQWFKGWFQFISPSFPKVGMMLPSWSSQLTVAWWVSIIYPESRWLLVLHMDMWVNHAIGGMETHHSKSCFHSPFCSPFFQLAASVSKLGEVRKHHPTRGGLRNQQQLGRCLSRKKITHLYV